MMPEGFSSIADLKFVVDASTEKLAGNMQLAKNIVARFTEESTEKLSLFERAVGGLGDGAAALSARANLWAASLRTVSAHMDEIREKGAQIAAIGGQQDEWAKLVGAYDEMIKSVREGLPVAVGLAGQALRDYATSADTAKNANAGIVQSAEAVAGTTDRQAQSVKFSADEITARLAQLSEITRQHAVIVDEAANNGAESWDRFAVAHASKAEAIVADQDKTATSFFGLIASMKALSHEFNRLKDEAGWSPETTERELERQADLIKKRSADMRSGMALGNSIADELIGNGNTDAAFSDLLTMFGEFYDRVEAERERNRAASQAALDEEIEAHHEATKKTLAGVDREIDGLHAKAAALDMTKGEAAAYAMVQRVIADLTAKYILLTEQDAAALGLKADAIRDLVDKEEARAKAKADGDAADRYMKSLESEIRNLEQQSGMLGKSTTEIAANNAEMRFRNQLADQGIKLSNDQAAKADAAIAKIRSETEANSERRQALNEETTQTRTFDQAILSLQRQTIALRGKTDALFDNSEAGRINALVEQQLNELKARGVPITEQRIAGLRREAAAQIDAALAQEQAQRQLEVLRSYATTVTGSLEGAFRKWTDSGKFNVKEMVASMMADMAQLTFKRGVTDSLMSLAFGGGGSGGGGLLSGLLGGGGGGDVGLGSWAPTISGYRADGGDVEAGRAYMVGERGPEPFIPRVPGTIIPNGGLGNAINVTLSTTIDARGATEGTASLIQRALSERDAQLPSQIMTVVQSGRDRGLV